MNNQIAAFSVCLLALAAQPAAAGPAGFSPGSTRSFTPITIDPDYPTVERFAGRWITRKFVQNNFARGEVMSYGACDDGYCDLQFTELTASYIDNSTIIIESTTVFLSEDTCGFGPGCRNGYKVLAQNDTEIVIDGEAFEVRGVTDLSMGYDNHFGMRLMGDIGYISWTEDSSGVDYRAYDHHGRFVEGYGWISSSVGEEWCASMVRTAVAFSAGAASYPVGWATFEIIEALSARLGAEVLLSGHPVAGLFIGVGGLTLAQYAKNIARVGVTGLLTVSFEKHVDIEAMCEDFADSDIVPAFTTDSKSEDVVDPSIAPGAECPDGSTKATCKDCRDIETTETTDDGMVVTSSTECTYSTCCVAE